MLARPRCPECSRAFRTLTLKRQFTCATCGTLLCSNRTEATLLAFVAALVAAPFIWMPLAAWLGFVRGSPASYDDWLWIVTLPCSVLMLGIYSRIVKVTRASTCRRDPDTARGTAAK